MLFEGALILLTMSVSTHPYAHVIVEGGEVRRRNEAAIVRVTGGEEEEIQNAAMQTGDQHRRQWADREKKEQDWRREHKWQRVHACSSSMLVMLSRS